MSDKRKLSAHRQLTRARLDARVRKSRDALGDALVSLMREKEFDEITVQEVLDRAGVSRSTFYQHFRDKEDLFATDAAEFFDQIANALQRQDDRSDRVFPVREFFEHIRVMEGFVSRLASAGKLHENMALARARFANGIERRLSVLGRARGVDPATRPIVALVFAGVVVSMLLWWIDQQMAPSPNELDELFHRLLWNGLETRTPTRTTGPWV